ncbi:MAG: NfeD family protein [Pyrinomonadaceae bacterium]
MMIASIFLSYFTMVLAAVLALLVILIPLLSHQKRVTSRDLHLIGSTGTVETDLTPNGSVIINGELWPAVAAGLMLSKGQSIRVARLRGASVEVAPLSLNQNRRD